MCVFNLIMLQCDSAALESQFFPKNHFHRSCPVVSVSHLPKHYSWIFSYSLVYRLLWVWVLLTSLTWTGRMIHVQSALHLWTSWRHWFFLQRETQGSVFCYFSTWPWWIFLNLSSLSTVFFKLDYKEQTLKAQGHTATSPYSTKPLLTYFTGILPTYFSYCIALYVLAYSYFVICTVYVYTVDPEHCHFVSLYTWIWLRWQSSRLLDIDNNLNLLC